MRTILLRTKDGEPALWLDENLGDVTLSDNNSAIDLTPDEFGNLDTLVAEWKHAVQWSDEDEPV